MNAEVERSEGEQPKVPAAEPTEPKYMLYDRRGNPVFTSRHALPHEWEGDFSKKMKVLLPMVLREAFAADVLGKDIAILHQPLHGIDFRGIDLSDVTFSGCSFRDSDLRGVCLTGADLESCNFGGALMQNADLTGAQLHGADMAGVHAYNIFGVILMGELDGYLVWAFPRKSDKLLRIRAGCRDFTLERARAHWEGSDGRAEIHKSLDFIEFMAKRRDWLIEAPALNEVDDEDDL